MLGEGQIAQPPSAAAPKAIVTGARFSVLDAHVLLKRDGIAP